jgi:hypothetical protein
MDLKQSKRKNIRQERKKVGSLILHDTVSILTPVAFCLPDIWIFGLCQVVAQNLTLKRLRGDDIKVQLKLQCTLSVFRP